MEDPKKMKEELWYELVTVLVTEKDKEFYAKRHLVDIDNKTEVKLMSNFKGILKFFKIKPHKLMSIEVILENALDGTIWKYDFDEDLWYFYGSTRGYV